MGSGVLTQAIRLSHVTAVPIYSLTGSVQDFPFGWIFANTVVSFVHEIDAED